MDKEMFGIIVGAFFTILIIGGIVIGILLGVDAISCSKTAEVLDYKYQYSIWTGCVVEKPNGEKFLLEQLRDVGENR